MIYPNKLRIREDDNELTLSNQVKNITGKNKELTTTGVRYQYTKSKTKLHRYLTLSQAEYEILIKNNIAEPIL